MKDCCSAKGVNKRTLDYIGIGVVVLLLVGSALIFFNLSSSEEVIVGADLDLDKYRGEGIPDDCRLPVYEGSVESWKEHLGHHEDTFYCLEYFE